MRESGLSIGTNGGLVSAWYGTSGFHKMQGIFGMPEQLLDSQGTLCSTFKCRKILQLITHSSADFTALLS